MMQVFHKKIVIVTGAARGIGKNIAVKFATAGAYVVIADQDDASANTVVEQIRSAGNNSEYYKVDLSKIEQAESMIRDVMHKHGRIDVLVNNARSGIQTEALHESEENWDVSLDVSLKAPLFMSQTFIQECTDNVEMACIINISSVTAQKICNESAVYHAAKAGLENLTRYLAVYGGPKGIRVNAVSPGFIVQDEHQERYLRNDNASYRQIAESCHPLKRVGTSDDVANATLFLCSDQASFITGQVLTVDGGLTVQDPYSLMTNSMEAKHAIES